MYLIYIIGKLCWCGCVCVFLHDARQSTVGVEFSIEIHRLIDKVLVGINYIVLTRLEKNVLGLHKQLSSDYWKNPLRFWNVTAFINGTLINDVSELLVSEQRETNP